MTAVASSPMTAAQLERLSFPDKQVELVRGRLLVREPPGSWHGRVSARLTSRLGEYALRHDLGDVFGQDTGFRIAADPDTVRGADVAFVAAARMHLVPRRGYAALAPDLVAEVLSPDDRPGEVLAKVGDWLDAGTRLVWVIDPTALDARVYRGDGTLAIIGIDGSLDGEAVVPGFTVRLREIVE